MTAVAVKPLFHGAPVTVVGPSSAYTTTTTNNIAPPLIHLYLRPSVHGPGRNLDPILSRRYTGMMYAKYRPTVQIPVMAKYAHGTPVLVPKYAGIVMMNANADTASTAY